LLGSWFRKFDEFSDMGVYWINKIYIFKKENYLIGTAKLAVWKTWKK